MKFRLTLVGMGFENKRTHGQRCLSTKNWGNCPSISRSFDTFNTSWFMRGENEMYFVKVYVTYKDSVLDPQGEAVKNAFHRMGNETL